MSSNTQEEVSINNMTKDPKERFWEVDFLRGFAVVMMIVFHCLYDLTHFALIWVNIYSGFWWVFGRATAIIFFFLVGVSLTLSYSRLEKNKQGETWFKYLKRGLRIFGYGMLITLVVYLFMSKTLIVFGALHFIGVAIILSRPFFNLRFWNFILGGSIIGVGLYLKHFRFDFPWLLWLGFRHSGSAAYHTYDYFPLLPWFGVVLLGIFFGSLLYPNGVRRFSVRNTSFPPARLLCLMGRKSLPIYFIHQPVLIGIIYAFVI